MMKMQYLPESKRRVRYRKLPLAESKSWRDRKARLWNPVTQRWILSNNRNRRSIQKQIENYSKNKLVLISCTKTKSFQSNEKINAEQAYCSPLFEKSKRWAEQRGLDYAILSAKYGLIWPDEQIEDYDLTINELSKRDKMRWGKEAIDEIHEWRLKRGDLRRAEVKGMWPPAKPSAEIIMLSGQAYTEPIKNEIQLYTLQTRNKGERPVINEPLAGLQVGERLKELNFQTGKIAPFKSRVALDG